MPFSIVLKGVGFPLDEAMQNNLGARQRIKIVLAGDGPGSNCGTDVPPEFVEGIGCTNGLTCSSRPKEFNQGLKKSVAERSHHSNFSDQSSVKILLEFRKTSQNSSEIHKFTWSGAKVCKPPSIL